MFVHDAKGRCLGIAARVRRVNPVDEAALRSAFGNRNRRLAEMLKPIRAAHAESLREQTAHTQAVIDAIQSPAERAAARAVQRVDVAEELLKRPVVETLRTVDQNDW
jgi:hypothetical protein